MHAKNGDLIQHKNYESDMICVGKSDVEEEPCFWLEQMDRQLHNLLYGKFTRRGALQGENSKASTEVENAMTVESR